MHIISDSDEEVIEAQSNNNARAQRTVSISLLEVVTGKWGSSDSLLTFCKHVS